MTGYAAAPNEYRVPEYNPAGDSGNGYRGTVSPEAITNQVNSSTGGSGGNPYADILKYLPQSKASMQSLVARGMSTSSVSNPDGGAFPPPDSGGVDSPPAPPPPAPPVAPPDAPPPGERGRPSAPPPIYDADHPPPKPEGTEDPEIAADWYRKFSYINPIFSNITAADVSAYRGDPQGKTFADWYLDQHPSVPPLPPSTPAPTDAGGSPAVPPSGPVPPPRGGGGGVPQIPGPSAPSTDDYSGILAQLQKLMGGQFDYEQSQLNRRMNAQAAITGDINSGGYGEVSGRANAQLAADQGNRLSGYLNTDWQSALDRALQTYGIDTQAATGRYSADAGVAAASQGAGASMYAANLGFQEAQIRDATSRYQGNQQYDLGLAGLGLDKYKFDNPNINALLGYYLQMSPEQLAMFASNPQLFPGYAYRP